MIEKPNLSLQSGNFPRETFFEIFQRNGASESMAIMVPGGVSLSYKDFSGLVQGFRNVLAGAKISAESTVSIVLPNSLEFAVSFLGISNSRCVCAPLNPGLSRQEFKFYLSDSKSKLVLVPKGQIQANIAPVQAAQELGIPVAEVFWDKTAVRVQFQDPKLRNEAKSREVPLPSDVALLLHTSGTTGLPKAVPLTHANILRTMNNVIATYSLTQNDRTLLVMPLFHVHGLVAGLLSTLLSGGTVVIPPKFSASTFWEEFLVGDCTWYTAVPTIHQILLTHKDSKSPKSTGRLRFIRSCSSSLAPATFKALEKAFGVPVLEAYAMTEAAHQVSSNPLPPFPRKAGSVGKGQGVEITIRDETGKEVKKGEVCIRGANVTKGYLNNPKANATSFHEGGWFRTGDEGMLDSEGYLTLTGRIKELINRGGEKIAPGEIDQVLLENPAVAEAVTFAVPDEKYGQDVQAAVVLREGQSATEEQLRKWVSERLVAFKTPKRVYITKQIPKTATGKIQRAKVSESFFKPQSKL